MSPLFINSMPNLITLEVSLGPLAEHPPIPQCLLSTSSVPGNDPHRGST